MNLINKKVFMLGPIEQGLYICEGIVVGKLNDNYYLVRLIDEEERLVWVKSTWIVCSI